jgi:hypothetical protein
VEKLLHLFRPILIVAVCGLIIGVISTLLFVLPVEAHQATMMFTPTSTLTPTSSRTTTRTPYNPQGEVTRTPYDPLTPTPYNPQGEVTRTPYDPLTPTPYNPQGQITPTPYNPDGEVTVTPYNPHGYPTRTPYDPRGEVTPTQYIPVTRTPYNPHETRTARPTATPKIPGCPYPKLEINYLNGAPGSSFTIYGSCYPANIDLAVWINTLPLNAETGLAQASSIQTDAEGRFTLQLSTSAEATPGRYEVQTKSEGALTGASYVLNVIKPVRTPEEPFQSNNHFKASIPAHVPAQTYTYRITLPVVKR